MTIPLPEAAINVLKSVPESGMGHQLATLQLSNGTRIINAVIFNASEVQIPELGGVLQVTAIDIQP